MCKFAQLYACHELFLKYIRHSSMLRFRAYCDDYFDLIFYA